MLSISLPTNASIRKLVKSPSDTKRNDRSVYKSDYTAFVQKYPIYKETGILDSLRKAEFGRLEKAREVYVDYMGGCLWPKALVARHASVLASGLFGNTHSDSPW
jgi:molybdenum cofactor sulfurtransferase